MSKATVRGLKGEDRESYKLMAAKLKKRGIKIRHQRHCWLRGRLHRYVGEYKVSSDRRETTLTVCSECGHVSRGADVRDELTYV